MSLTINDTCISCGACEAVCPVQAISQGDQYYVIDRQRLRGMQGPFRRTPVRLGVPHRFLRQAVSFPVPRYLPIAFPPRERSFEKPLIVLAQMTAQRFRSFADPRPSCFC